MDFGSVAAVRADGCDRRLPILTAPRVNDADGVSAVRGVLGISWFNEATTRRGLARLQGLQKIKIRHAGA